MLWQPLPRHRPGQFLAWTLDSLSTLNLVFPGTFGELVQLLEQRNLPHIATALQVLLLRQASHKSAASLEHRPVSELLNGHPAGKTEKHPQARKFAQVVSQYLDQAWKEAFEIAAQDYLAEKRWPRAALVLGGLPPSFRVLSDYIFADIDELALFDDHASLPVLVFYGLASGGVPSAPEPWCQVIERLEAFEVSELQLFNSLSPMQATRLRQCGTSGIQLLRLQQELNCSLPQWRAFMNALEGLSEEDFTNVVAAQQTPAGVREPLRFSKESVSREVRFLAERWTYGLQHLLQARSLLESGAWQTVRSFDEELMRMVERKKLNIDRLASLQEWDEELWHTAQHLLKDNSDWVFTYFEDRQTLTEYLEARTQVRLNLRDVFPQTFAALDTYLNNALRDILVCDVGELETFATAVSQRIQQRLWVEAYAV